MLLYSRNFFSIINSTLPGYLSDCEAKTGIQGMTFPLQQAHDFPTQGQFHQLCFCLGDWNIATYPEGAAQGFGSMKEKDSTPSRALIQLTSEAFGNNFELATSSTPEVIPTTGRYIFTQYGIPGPSTRQQLYSITAVNL